MVKKTLSQIEGQKSFGGISLYWLIVKLESKFMPTQDTAGINLLLYQTRLHCIVTEPNRHLTKGLGEVAKALTNFPLIAVIVGDQTTSWK